MDAPVERFRIHPKGHGSICVRREGIPAYEFVADYIGELYPPWRWFEKQDAVKMVKKEKGLANVLSDFYNIMLERHIDDADGYDVLYVDPLRRCVPGVGGGSAVGGLVVGR